MYADLAKNICRILLPHLPYNSDISFSKNKNCIRVYASLIYLFNSHGRSPLFQSLAFAILSTSPKTSNVLSTAQPHRSTSY
ncbi:hypothetical protein HUJ04_004931 [Dendroctonus ponderosae]|nr:hypothetical protein HUJ04_004931 [Dendroctonus ponderosae]